MKITSKSLKGLLLCFVLFILIQSHTQASNPADITIDRNGVLLKGKFHAAQCAGPFPTVLLFGSWDDWQVPFDLITFPFYKALKKKAENVLLVGLQDDHYFKNTRDKVAKTLIQWLRTRERSESL